MVRGINLFIFRKALPGKEIGKKTSGECGMGNGEWRQKSTDAERRTLKAEHRMKAGQQNRKQPRRLRELRGKSKVERRRASGAQAAELD
jgi:hypothetical protein